MNSEEIQHSLSVLRKGKTLLYPTDTVWGIGCDATNSSAVSKVYTIKKRSESKSLIILVNSLEMLSNYIKNIPTRALDVIKSSKKPTTIIYDNPKGLAKNCIAIDDTIAIRIVKNDFCKALIKEFGKPIVSTSANISGEQMPKSFSEIPTTILDSVDYIVNLHQNKIANMSSTILRITADDEIEVIRA